jgi:hypothetical protein
LQEEKQIGGGSPVFSSVLNLSSLSHSLSIHHQLDEHIGDLSLIASIADGFTVA